MDERALELERSRPAPDRETWERVKGALADRAESEGLLDVAFERHETPLGTMLLAGTGEGLVRVGFPGEDEDELLAELAARVSPRILAATREPLLTARRQLDEYFDGARRRFEIDLDWRLTGGFRQKVLRATAEIPFGRTATYTEVATAAGSARAVRAAGSALGSNPLAIVVPCHRVLRVGGALGGYRGGLEAKRRLLELEGVL